MAHLEPRVEFLARQLIEAYERGEECPPATASALREVLPPNPACPSACPYHPMNHAGRRARLRAGAHCADHRAAGADAHEAM